jgi:peptidyl-prolyl cis-trans isomerase SurA
MSGAIIVDMFFKIPVRNLIHSIAVAVLSAGVWLGLPNISLAQQIQGIAAIVNNEIITGYDLNARIRFTLFSSGLSPDLYKRIAPQVLGTLIDEKLKLQEAARKKIRVPHKDLQRAIRSVEQRNKLPPGGMVKLLESNGIDPATFERQVETDLAWNSIVQIEGRHRIHIDEETIQDAINLINANKGKPEYLAAEIFLAYDRSKPEAEVKQVADRLFDQLKNGARFPALASSFSQSASAANGGSLGWLRIDQIDPDLAEVLQQMKRGDLSRPVRGTDGYYILFLRNKRVAKGLEQSEASIDLLQLFLRVNAGDPEETEQARQANLTYLKENAKDCAALSQLAGKLKSSKIGTVEDIKLGDIAANIREKIANLPENQLSETLRTSAGMLVVMVCKRHTEKTQTAIRNRIAENLARERADLLSRRMLRDLKRVAVVEIRR